MERAKTGMIRFMAGRYGSDALSRTTYMIGFIFLILSLFIRARLLSTLALVFFLLSLIRMYSRNIQKRYAENQKFLELTAKPRKYGKLLKMRIQYRKTHKCYLCTCGQILRVPKGRGTIEIRCPKCGRTQKKTT